jgi:hypothetical protein
VRRCRDAYAAVMERSTPIPFCGCLIFQGTVLSNGYGQISDHGRKRATHTIVYERTHGAMPPGLQIDHLCRVRSCVNVDHLEAVTCATNLNRAIGNAFQTQRAKTHCPQGHPYSGINLRMRKDGGRKCVVCIRESDRRQRLREKAKT